MMITVTIENGSSTTRVEREFEIAEDIRYMDGATAIELESIETVALATARAAVAAHRGA